MGPKVADCIALMGLGMMHVVPIDTHIWQLACAHYKFPSSKYKTLTSKNYAAIGQLFKDLFGPFAGWAHLFLFVAEIKRVSD